MSRIANAARTFVNLVQHPERAANTAASTVRQFFQARSASTRGASSSPQIQAPAPQLSDIAKSGGLQNATGHSPSFKAKVNQAAADVGNLLVGGFTTSGQPFRGSEFIGLQRLAKDVQTALADTTGSPQAKQQLRDAVANLEDGLQEYATNQPGKLPNAETTLSTLKQAVHSLDADIKRTKAGVSDQALQRTGGTATSSGTLAELGSGQISSVHTGQFSGFGPGVFKSDVGNLREDLKKNPMPAGRIDIPNENPNLAGRSVASSVTNDLLGLKLVGRTQFASHEGQHGFVTEFAPGKSPQGEEILVPLTGKDLLGAKVAAENNFPLEEHQIAKDDNFFSLEHTATNFNFKEPSIARGLTELQLFDELTGQADRHWGNAFIELDANNELKSLTAIDNDLSFGSKNSYDQVGKASGLHSWDSKLPANLPPTVPRETADKFLKLTADELRQSLDGILQPAEIDAAVERLGVIQDHLENLDSQGKLLSNDAWAKHDFSDFRDDNSYAGKFEKNLQLKHAKEVESGVSLIFDPGGQPAYSNVKPSDPVEAAQLKQATKESLQLRDQPNIPADPVEAEAHQKALDEADPLSSVRNQSYEQIQTRANLEEELLD